MKKSSFTLLELVAVMAIIALTTALAVSTFRGNSPARQLDEAELELETFFARVRYQAQEQGEDKLVCFDPELRRFQMDTPTQSDTVEPEPPHLQWTLPEKFVSDPDLSDLIADEQGRLIVCRFFPDGGASSSTGIKLQLGNLTRTFSLSPLTGRLIADAEEEL